MTHQEDQPEDRILLARYVAGQDEGAFRILVERHAGRVHYVARRVTASSVLADDVTQAVFVRLAVRAALLPQRVPLAAWLHRTGRSLAIDMIRAQERRKKLEHAAFLSTAMDPPQKTPSWSELSPVIDELVDRLPPVDRDILLLRYYDGRSLGSIGRQHGLTEDAAGKRAARALDKLRVMLGKRGIVSSVVALETLLPAHAAIPASQALTLTIVSAVRGIAPAVSGSLFTSTILTMTTKTIAVATATVVLLSSAAYLAFENSRSSPVLANQPWDPVAGSSRATPVAADPLVTARTGHSPKEMLDSPAAPRGASSAVGKPGSKRQVDPEEISALLKSSMMQSIMASRTSAEIQTTYGDLMDRLQLSPEERDHMQKLLVEKQTNLQNVTMQLMSPALSEEARSGLQKQLTEAWLGGEAKIHSFLNDEADFAYYKTYTQQGPERKEVGMFQALLKDGEPLSPTTSDALAKLQNEARKSFPFTVDFYDQRNFSNPAVLNAASVQTFLDEQARFQEQTTEKAAGLLTPAQLQAYRQNQAAIRQLANLNLGNIVQMSGGR